MYASDFVYDGTSLSSFGCVICRFDGDAGIEEVQAGAPLNFTTVSRRKGNKFSLVDTSYDSALEATFEICKDSCDYINGDDMIMSDELYLSLSRWLLRNEFLEVFFLNDDHILERHYNGAFNISKLMVDDKLYGLRLTLTTDRPYALGNEISTMINVDNNKNMLEYPYANSTTTINGITFTDNGDGTITLNGRSTGSISYEILQSDIELDQGNYVLSIGTEWPFISYSSVFGYNLSSYESEEVNDKSLSLSIGSNVSLDSVYLHIASGERVNNVTIYPMLRLSSKPSVWVPPIGVDIYCIDTSYLTGTIIPDLTITCLEAGDLHLSNEFTGSNMVIKNCSANEVITVDGDAMLISSSNSSHKLWNDFNFEFFKIGNSYHIDENIISSSIACNLTIKYKPIIRDAP